MNQHLYNLAKGFEARGQIDSAAEGYARAGSLDDAARVLSSQRRFLDAAQLVMKHLGLQVEDVASSKPEHKKTLVLAAICYAKAGETQTALDMFMGLREFRRAADVLEKNGDRVGAAKVLAMEGKGSLFNSSRGPSSSRSASLSSSFSQAKVLEEQHKYDLALEAYVQLKRPADAGRMADKLGRYEEAGSFFAEAGMAFEAGQAFTSAGEIGRALDNWVRVPRGDQRYRQACHEVIRGLHGMEALNLQIEVFLGNFISEGLREEKDLQSFYLLGKAYVRHDLLENAKEVFRKLLKVSPKFRDVTQILEGIDSQTRGSVADFHRVLQQDQSFREADRMPHSGREMLPDLPDLPDLPPVMGIPLQSSNSFFHGPKSGPSTIIDQDLPTISAPASDSQKVIIAAATPAPIPVAVTALHSDTMTPSMTPTPLLGSPQRPLQANDVLGGRYRIVGQLGQGGMATVFEVEDTELSEHMALKLFSSGPGDGAGMARFKQELKLSRQLAHRNIVQVYDIGVHNNQRYITMELLQGQELRAVMSKVLSVDTALGYIMQACKGLHHAHESGVVHRDIKPENLFITKQNVLKVMDFGIAKNQAVRGLTVAGMVAGTPAYMAPEQISNMTNVSAATDLYALGVILFEMLAGRVPFDHPDLMPLLMMHLQTAPPLLRSFNPTVSVEVEQLVSKLLEKDPKHRFASGEDLWSACQAIRQGLAG